MKALSFGFENIALKFTAGFSQIFDPNNKISWVSPEKRLGSMTINNREIKLHRWRGLRGVSCLELTALLATRSPSKAVRGRWGCKRNFSSPWIWALWCPSSLPTLSFYDKIIDGWFKKMVLAPPDQSIFWGGASIFWGGASSAVTLGKLHRLDRAVSPSVK